MGWAAGEGIANGIWGTIRPLLAKEHRAEAAGAIIDALESQDWDTQDGSVLLFIDAGREEELVCEYGSEEDKESTRAWINEFRVP